MTTRVPGSMNSSGIVSAFEYLTDAQIAAAQSYTFATDLTTPLQNALNAAHAAKMNLYIPAGGYLVTGLTIPGTVDGVSVDDRNKGFRIFGQGFGEPFVHTNTGGTVLKSVTNAPVLTDILGTVSSSNGTVEIDHIRFDGTSSTTPVVRLQSFYGLSSLRNCVIYQRGTGDGLTLGWGATVRVDHCYVMNKDWATSSLGAGRVGTGISYAPTADNGLVTITKCTSRGWLTAFNLGGAAGAAYSAAIEKCEASVVRNGMVLAANAAKCQVIGSYLEGGDGGVGITVGGDFTTIADNLIFPGFATGIQDTSTANKGTLITGNVVSMGALANGIAIDISSSASFGGFSKTVFGNTIVYTLGTNGVNGIKIAGTNPRLTITGNAFDPKDAWTGTNTLKVNDTSTGGVQGLTTAGVGSSEFPVLSRGAIALHQSDTALTQADVSANILTVPEGSYMVCTATSAATVQRFAAGPTQGRLVTFRTTNANMTFTDTAYNQLAGGASFTGPGTITFLIDKIGADNYAWEISRTVF